jgi:predicted DCC family thiol-disulfide oxidoreductase YuxK
MNPSDESQAEQLLIYDGECRLCVTAKNGLEHLDRGGRCSPGASSREPSKVRFVAYQSEEAADRLGAGYRPGRPDVAFLVDTQGRVQQGLDAFLPLLPGLPGGRLLLLLLRLPFLRPLAYLLYRLVARHRYRLFGQVPYRPDEGDKGETKWSVQRKH